MPLVDYPPSDSDSENEGLASPANLAEPPAKRRKGLTTARDATSLDRASDQPASAAPGTDLPPLPQAFHDLYASTVRRSVFDDPSLHQGRKRQTPHVAGNWPTHLYIEWHPSRAQYDLLVHLIRRSEEVLKDHHGTQLHDFLTSDLGTPVPLHISLSRPIALDTAHKDEYLERVSSAIAACNTGSFSVSPKELIWYQSPDSNRTFLVLRVASNAAAAGAAADASSKNPELAALLVACNDVARRFDQPVLYHEGPGEDSSVDGDAFHVSIGWTFGLAATDQAAVEALKLFDDEPRFREARTWEIDISGIKAKIGNVVNHIPLSSRQPSRSLFGI